MWAWPQPSSIRGPFEHWTSNTLGTVWTFWIIFLLVWSIIKSFPGRNSELWYCHKMSRKQRYLSLFKYLFSRLQVLSVNIWSKIIQKRQNFFLMWFLASLTTLYIKTLKLAVLKLRNSSSWFCTVWILILVNLNMFKGLKWAKTQIQSLQVYQNASFHDFSFVKIGFTEKPGGRNILNIHLQIWFSRA